MILDVFLGLMQTLITIAFWHLILHAKGYNLVKENQFKWRCQEEGCYFEVSASHNYGVVIHMADFHTESHKENDND